MSGIRLPALCAALVAALLAGAPASAQAQEINSELQAVKQQMKRLQESYQHQIDALMARISTLEQQQPQREPVAQAAAAAAAPSARSRTPTGRKFQFGLSTTGTGGGSSVDSPTLGGLQAGDHDPRKNGFTLQNAELFLGGTVDPYFDAQASIAFKLDDDGETAVELEEVFATTRALPFGLQVKAGQFYSEFGRLNVMHPHAWNFVDQPVVLSRLLGGEGQRAPGAMVSWLTPLPWFSELAASVQNSKGGTTSSFLFEAGEAVGGHTLIGRNVRNLGDLLYTARWLNGFDVSDNLSVNVGASGAFGPNGTGNTTDTYLIGGDVYFKWQPDQTVRGFPFIAFHGEGVYRNYEAGDRGDPLRETLEDWGFFAQTTWGFTPGWVAGLRVDRATGDGNNNADPLRDSRWRISPALTWFPTEFSKLRLQYNRDWADHLERANGKRSADTLWMQVEFALGDHFAHTF